MDDLGAREYRRDQRIRRNHAKQVYLNIAATTYVRLQAEEIPDYERASTIQRCAGKTGP